jgi:molybdopterin-guanine dinucleotide biosynthesis protein A
MPAAVLAGGASRRMGSPKAALPYGSGSLAEHQTSRLARAFEEVWLVVRDAPEFPVGPARILLDTDPVRSALSGVLRALEEAADRVLLLAVDLPLVPEALLAELARRSLASDAAAVLPENAGELEPLAGVWRRSALTEGRRRAAAGERSLRDFARAVGAETMPESAWRDLDPSGNAFTNVNTVDDWLVARSRA